MALPLFHCGKGYGGRAPFLELEWSGRFDQITHGAFGIDLKVDW